MAIAALSLAQQPTAPKTQLKIGDAAPDFTLMDNNGNQVKLSDFKGKKNVVLAFYVLAFTGGWEKELKAYQADIAKFDETGTQVLGISVDSAPANAHWAKELGVTFPVLSDFKRTVVQEYGIYNEARGYANRATFVIDKEGIIRHIEQGSTAIDPSGAYQACSLAEKKK
jgi:peroxiredoxin